MATQALRTFPFVSHSIRVVMLDGEPWFVAKDIAEALDYVWKGVKGTISHVPEKWRGVCSVQTPSGDQEMAIISEQGLYFFLGRSDKPKALPFQEWYAGEVLPAIRKTGRYVAPQAAPQPVMPALLSSGQLAQLSNQIWMLGRAFYMEGSVRHWLFKYACARAGVTRRDHIPASFYPEIEDFLNTIDRAVGAYRDERIEHEKNWLRLTLQRELDRRLGRAGPEFELLAAPAHPPTA